MRDWWTRFWASIAYLISPEPPDESGEKRGGRWARLIFRVTLFVGSAAILGYAAQFTPLTFLRVASLGSLLAAAGLVAGGLIGFLFGIPRTLQQALPTPPAGEANLEASADRDASRPEYRGNTNLEQISDWLTKILVGVTLTQFGDLVDFLRRAVVFLAPGFGEATMSRPFVLGVLLFFPTCGFLLGYLLTRLYLPLALRRSDIDLEGQRRRGIDEDVTLGRRRLTQSPVKAAPLLKGDSADAMLREQIRALASEYERRREALPPGWERTRKMELIASQMRALAPVALHLVEELRQSRSPGERLAAITFLQVRPDADSPAWLAERVCHEKPFIGYHAALALLYAARAIPGVAGLEEAVRKAAQCVPPSSDRGHVLAEAAKLVREDS